MFSISPSRSIAGIAHSSPIRKRRDCAGTRATNSSVFARSRCPSVFAISSIAIS
jgi:hypothetical protein